MSLDPAALAAILAMAAATWLTRFAGLWVVRLVPLTGRMRAGLDAVPPAILMAVIAPVVFATGPAETLAAGVTVLAALRLPLVAAVGAGVAAVVALRMLGL